MLVQLLADSDKTALLEVLALLRSLIVIQLSMMGSMMVGHPLWVRVCLPQPSTGQTGS